MRLKRWESVTSEVSELEMFGFCETRGMFGFCETRGMFGFCEARGMFEYASKTVLYAKELTSLSMCYSQRNGFNIPLSRLLPNSVHVVSSWVGVCYILRLHGL